LQGADFSALPPELVHPALVVVCASDVAAANQACRAWRDATDLQPGQTTLWSRARQPARRRAVVLQLVVVGHRLDQLIYFLVFRVSWSYYTLQGRTNRAEYATWTVFWASQRVCRRHRRPPRESP
jgi:hypothetical protein